jgi:hypothetical protein
MDLVYIPFFDLVHELVYVRALERKIQFAVLAAFVVEATLELGIEDIALPVAVLIRVLLSLLAAFLVGALLVILFVRFLGVGPHILLGLLVLFRLFVLFDILMHPRSRLLLPAELGQNDHAVLEVLDRHEHLLVLKELLFVIV